MLSHSFSRLSSIFKNLLRVFLFASIFVGSNVMGKAENYSLVIDSVIVDETAGSALLTVRVDPKIVNNGDTITVNYTTTDGSAIAPFDYTSQSGSVSLNKSNSGSQFATAYISIPIVNDALPESQEEFYVDISSATIVSSDGSSITIATSRGDITINDDDVVALQPTLSVNSITVDENASEAIFTVSLDYIGTSDVTFSYATGDGTALAGSDYTTVTGTGIIPAGTLSVTIAVPIIDDLIAGEGNENFYLNLANISNAQYGTDVGTATIVDNDTALSLAINDASVAETDSNTTANVNVIFSQALPTDINITVYTQDGTAKTPGDYQSIASQLVTISAGSTSYTLTVGITGDTVQESTENFYVIIGSATGGVVIADGNSTFTIFDNDNASGCSSYTGLMTINEYQNNPNYKDSTHPLASNSGKVPGNYVEIKYIDFLVKQYVNDLWQVAIYTTAGSQGLTWDQRDPSCIDPRYEVFQFNNNVMGAQGYVVLTDANGNEVDILNIDNSNHYAQQCTSFPYDTDFGSSAQKKDIFRDPDGTGDWYDQGSGANSGGSRCVNRSGGGGGGLNFQEFDALDSDEPLPISGVSGAGDVPLKTKVVNQGFTINVIAIDRNTSMMTSVTANIKVTLADKFGYQLPNAPVVDASFAGSSSETISFPGGYDRAYNNARIQFLYCYDTAGNVADYDECYVTNPDPSYQQAAESRDNYAIRPDAFDTNITDGQYLVAGKDESILFTADDAGGNPTVDYNESENTSFAINLALLKSGCQPITKTPDVNFTDGSDNDTYRFNNVGEVNMTIAETAGSEYALVDDDDTPDLQRYISPKSVVFNLIPDHFDINATLDDFGNGFTYLYDINLYDDYTAMSANLNIDIEAKSYLNNTMTNYTEDCYAKATDLNMSFKSPIDILPLTGGVGPLSQFLWYNSDEDNGSTDSGEGNFTLPQPTTGISNLTIGSLAAAFPAAAPKGPGTATITYNLNFDRNLTKVVDPFKIDLDYVTIKDEDNVTGDTGTLTDQTVTYIYGRAHAPRYRVDCTTQNCQSQPLYIYYEFYSDDSTSNIANLRQYELADDSLRSKDAINWFQNNAHDTATDGVVTGTQQKGGGYATDSGTGSYVPYNGSTSILYNYAGTNGYPYKGTIEINANRWLIYNRYNSNALVNEFELEFNNLGTQVAPTNQAGFTGEDNASINTSRRIQW